MNAKLVEQIEVYRESKIRLLRKEYCSCENDPAAIMVEGIPTCCRCEKRLDPETM